MQTIADIILACAALGVAFYCFVLSRRLKRFNTLEHGVGGAVAVLSAQVDDLNRALDKARRATETSGSSLTELTERAEGVARRLELHVAAMHDLPAVAPQAEQFAGEPAVGAAGPAAVEPAHEPAAEPAHEPAAEPAVEPQADAPGPAPADPSVAALEPAPAVPSVSSAPAAAPAARPVGSLFATARKAEAVL